MIKSIILSMFLLLVGLPTVASADYSVFSINEIPANTSIASPNYAMTGVGVGSTAVFEYTADATVTQFDRLTLPFCRYGGTNTGTIYLEVRSSTTTGPIVASSTLAVNSGNIWSTGCNSTYINATTSTFVLNQNVQWLSGVKMYFIFRPVSTDASFMYSFRATIGYDTSLNGIYGELPSNFPMLYVGAYRLYTSAVGYALGIPPVVYNASSSNISCSTFDVGCYITQGLSLLFYPADWTFDDLNELQEQLASTTPFGYGYELVDAINTALNTATSSFAITADLSDFGSVFANATSVPIVSSEGIIAFAGDDWDTVQNLLAGALYLTLLSYFWMRFFHTI